MKIKKFLDKKTSKKTKIEILEKMLKAWAAAGGKLQAASLTMTVGCCRMNLERNNYGK